MRFSAVSLLLLFGSASAGYNVEVNAFTVDVDIGNGISQYVFGSLSLVMSCCFYQILKPKPDQPLDESGGLRGLQGSSPVAWRQGHVPGNPGSTGGYAFSVDQGAGFSERLRITSDGQLQMTAGGAQPVIKMGDERNGWQIVAGRGSFTVLDLGRSNVVPFRIDGGAPENTLKINQDGSISVARAIVNGINITALDQRLARFESVITIEDDGTATFEQGASVVGCLDVVGDCTSFQGPRPTQINPRMNDSAETPVREGPGERRDLQKAAVEFGTLHKKVLELENTVEKLSNQLKELEKPQT